MQDLVKKHVEKLRFGLVGIANTALDFLVLFLLVALGTNEILGNYISTSVALVFSFFVNKSFTFQHKGGSLRKQFAIFLVITLIGLWVIQPLIIAGVTAALAGSGWSEAFVLFIAKVVATAASLTWNYIFYSRLVFKKGK